MTPEEKQLLIKDLCERLPYGVMVHFKGWGPKKLSEINLMNEDVYNGIPYLRPMSSMTKEEEKERNNIALFHSGNIASVPTYIDFLNKHHFDYRGLIEKGLALEAPRDMYKTE